MRSNKRRGIPSLPRGASLVLGGDCSCRVAFNCGHALGVSEVEGELIPSLRGGCCSYRPPALVKRSCWMRRPRCVERQPFPPQPGGMSPQLGTWSPAFVSSAQISHVSLGPLTDGNGHDPSQRLPVSPRVLLQRFPSRRARAGLPPVLRRRRFVFISGRLPG